MDDALIWDAGNLRHATRHGISREEIDAMYAAGDWVLDEQPGTEPDQERLIGWVPSTGRLITVVVEPRETTLHGWAYRPVTAWDSTAREAAQWRSTFGPSPRR